MDSVSEALKWRVMARFIQASDPDAQPINKQKGIDKTIIKNDGKTDLTHEDTIKPHKDDVTPKDVFPSTPNHLNVRNLYETGHDMDKAIHTQIPKDKGYDTVRNLSQYLIETKGGGGTKPVS